MRPSLTLFFAARALAAGISFSAAQDAPANKTHSPPSSINAGSPETHNSSAESQMKANGTRQRVAGKGKYCSQTSASGPLNCVYASLSACNKHSKGNNLSCVVNPLMGTTGSR